MGTAASAELMTEQVDNGNYRPQMEPEQVGQGKKSFMELPGELRNEIYNYTMRSQRRILLPRGRDAVADELNAAWALADFNEMLGFALARTNKQTRVECLGEFYRQNRFTFIFNCGGEEGDKAALSGLRDAISLMAPFPPLLEPGSFQVRFTNSYKMHSSTLGKLASCFGVMHEHGIASNMAMNQRIVLSSNIGSVSPICNISNHLFALGLFLSQQACTCGDAAHTSKAGCPMDIGFEVNRMILCRRHLRDTFLNGNIRRFMNHIGFRLSDYTMCPDGCCP